MIYTYKAKAFENVEKAVKRLKTEGIETISIENLERILSECSSQAFKTNQKPTGEETAEILTDFVNGSDNEERKNFVNRLTLDSHKTLQDSVFDLFLKSVDSWAENFEKDNYDGRNLYTVKTSKKIKDLLK